MAALPSPVASSIASSVVATSSSLKAGHDSKIFVGNLPFTASKLDLMEIFSPFGSIKGINIRKDRNTDKSRGFAFVTLDSADAAIAAIEGVHGKSMDGRVLTVKSALARGQNISKTLGNSAAIEEEDDSSWATAPPRRRRGRRNRNSYGKTKSSRNTDRNNVQGTDSGNRERPKKSWTEWASYPSENSYPTSISSQ